MNVRLIASGVTRRRRERWRRSDLDYREPIDALIAGEIDVAMVATQIDDSLLQRALGAPGIRLMNVAQAEAIAGGETVGTIGRIGSLE
jgi:hypothetical protein